jgi:hypothetical protein
VLQAIISYIVSLCSQLNSNYLLDCKHGQWNPVLMFVLSKGERHYGILSKQNG